MKTNPADDAKVQRATVGVKEAAQILGIGKNQAYAAARNGELPVVRIGGRILVSRAALEKMLQGE
jgi:excisionase family DNA binding protein